MIAEGNVDILRNRSSLNQYNVPYCCCCIFFAAAVFVRVVYKVYKTLSDCKQYRRFNIARSLTRLDSTIGLPSSTRFSSSQRKLQISKQHAEHATYQESTQSVLHIQKFDGKIPCINTITSS